MGMQKSDIATDAIVVQTVQAFKDAIAERYKDSNFNPVGNDGIEDMLAEQQPLVDMLAETDSLDSVTASVALAMHLVNYVDLSAVAPQLDARVATLVKLMNSDEMAAGPQALIAANDPAATKIGVAMITAMLSGEEIETLKTEADPGELAMFLGTVAAPVMDFAEHLAESGHVKELSPLLVDRFVGVLDGINEMTTSRIQKRMLTEIAQQLKTAVAKAAAEDIAAPAPAREIDPSSPFVQLKDQARKLKL